MHLSLKSSGKPFKTGPCIRVPTQTVQVKSGILRQSRSQRTAFVPPLPASPRAEPSPGRTAPWEELRASVPVC